MTKGWSTSQEEQDHVAAGIRGFVSGGESYMAKSPMRRQGNGAAKHVVIATGSRARHLQNIAVDNDSSATTKARSFQSVPSASA